FQRPSVAGQIAAGDGGGSCERDGSAWAGIKDGLVGRHRGARARGPPGRVGPVGSGVPCAARTDSIAVSCSHATVGSGDDANGTEDPAVASADGPRNHRPRIGHVLARSPEDGTKTGPFGRRAAKEI